MITVLGFLSMNADRVNLLTKDQLISRANYTFTFKTEIEYAYEKTALRKIADMYNLSKFVILRDLNNGEMLSIAAMRGYINGSDVNTYKRIIDANKI